MQKMNSNLFCGQLPYAFLEETNFQISESNHQLHMYILWAQQYIDAVLSRCWLGGRKGIRSVKQEAQLMLTNLRHVVTAHSRPPNIVPFHMLVIPSY